MKRYRIWLAVLLAGLALGLIIWASAPDESTRKVESILQRLDALQQVPAEGELETGRKYLAEEKLKAELTAMGTNAIPPLLRSLKAEDGPLTTKLAELAMRARFYHLPFEQAESLRNEAVRGFEILGPTASNAVPQLVELYKKHPSDDVRISAANALTVIRSDASQAVPALIDGSTNASEELRIASVGALGGIRSRPDIAIPSLERSLGDPSELVRVNAANSLGLFGFGATNALPFLIHSLGDPEYSVRDSALDAISAIETNPAILLPIAEKYTNDSDDELRESALAIVHGRRFVSPSD